MTDDSSRRNRHGIPLYGDPPSKCCWPRCSNPTGIGSGLPLCNAHASDVHAVVDREHAQVVQVLAERRRAMEERNRQTSERMAEETAQRRAARPQFVYYLQVGGHVKIGWTTQLDQRMRSYPPNTTLLALHPGTKADEKALHKRFAVHRSHGQEWYPLVPVILEHIKRVIAEHGAPPPMTFGAKPVEVRMPHRQKTQMAAKYGPTLRT